MSTAKTTRAKRALAPAAKKEFPAELRALAVSYYVGNKQANAYATKAKHDRAALYAGMKEAGIKNDVLTTIEGGKALSLAVVIGTPTRAVVDIPMLSKLVDVDTLFKIVSATQDAVRRFASESVLKQALVTLPGEENVTVKPAV